MQFLQPLSRLRTVLQSWKRKHVKPRLCGLKAPKNNKSYIFQKKTIKCVLKCSFIQCFGSIVTLCHIDQTYFADLGSQNVTDLGN